MNKQDLIDVIAKDAGITKKQSGIAAETVFRSIEKALRRGDHVTLVGFGTFSVRRRAARKARNPQTGQVIHVKAKKVPVFRPGARLKKAVG